MNVSEEDRARLLRALALEAVVADPQLLQSIFPGLDPKAHAGFVALDKLLDVVALVLASRAAHAA